MAAIGRKLPLRSDRFGTEAVIQRTSIKCKRMGIRLNCVLVLS